MMGCVDTVHIATNGKVSLVGCHLKGHQETAIAAEGKGLRKAPQLL